MIENVRSILDACSVAALGFGVVALLVTLVMLPFVIRRWIQVYRIYGGIPFSLAFDVWNYASRGALIGLQKAVIAIFTVGAILLITDSWLEMSVRNPWSWACFLYGCVLVFNAIALTVATPPAILLLGPSSPQLERELVTLNRSLPQYRTVCLLRPGELTYAVGGWHAWLNNFRTRDLYQWRTLVFHLMDVVPVIVFCGHDSAPVREEWERLQKRGYLDRTLTTSPAQLDNMQATQQRRAWLREKLAKVSDQQARSQRQSYLRKMRASVPPSLWYPETVHAMVAKIQELARFAINNFIAECKQGGLDAYTGQLVVDMPSLRSPAEELQFLQEDRAFEELEILLISAEEVVWQTGANREFNRANLYNKRGLVTSFRQDWQKAIRSIEAALVYLEPLSHADDADLAKLACAELGAAYCNLGDVYLSRYRESKDAADIAPGQEML